MPKMTLTDHEVEVIKQHRFEVHLYERGWNEAISEVLCLFEGETSEYTFNELRARIREMKK